MRVYYELAAGCLFKSVSPAASYLFCFAKISNQQKATPDRSKARNKINHLRRWGNSAAASVGGLKHIWTLPKVKHDDPQQLHRSCFFVNYISVILLTMRRAIAS
jgi:hypothetical protein